MGRGLRLHRAVSPLDIYIALNSKAFLYNLIDCIIDNLTIHIQIKINFFEVQLTHPPLLKVTETNSVIQCGNHQFSQKEYFLPPTFEDTELPKVQTASVCTHLPIIWYTVVFITTELFKTKQNNPTLVGSTIQNNKV